MLVGLPIVSSSLHCVASVSPSGDETQPVDREGPGCSRKGASACQPVGPTCMKVPCASTEVHRRPLSIQPPKDQGGSTNESLPPAQSLPPIRHTISCWEAFHALYTPIRSVRTAYTSICTCQPWNVCLPRSGSPTKTTKNLVRGSACLD